MKLLGRPEHLLSLWGLLRGIVVAIAVALFLTGLAYLLAHYLLGPYFV